MLKLQKLLSDLRKYYDSLMDDSLDACRNLWLALPSEKEISLNRRLAFALHLSVIRICKAIGILTFSGCADEAYALGRPATEQSCLFVYLYAQQPLTELRLAAFRIWSALKFEADEDGRDIPGYALTSQIDPKEDKRRAIAELSSYSAGKIEKAIGVQLHVNNSKKLISEVNGLFKNGVPNIVQQTRQSAFRGKSAEPDSLLSLYQDETKGGTIYGFRSWRLHFPPLYVMNLPSESTDLEFKEYSAAWRFAYLIMSVPFFLLEVQITHRRYWQTVFPSEIASYSDKHLVRRMEMVIQEANRFAQG